MKNKNNTKIKGNGNTVIQIIKDKWFLSFGLFIIAVMVAIAAFLFFNEIFQNQNKSNKSEESNNKYLPICVSLRQNSDSVKIGKFEITNEQYKLFVTERDHRKPNIWENPAFEKFAQPQCPVVDVSWHDAIDYCKWLESKFKSLEVRLPTEKEWEYAAKGDTSRIYPWGDEFPKIDFVNFGSQIGNTIPVNEKNSRPSFCMAYHMGGNIEEWCTSVDSIKVLKGGSWKSSPYELQISSSRPVEPNNKSLEIGFRIIIVKR